VSAEPLAEKKLAAGVQSLHVFARMLVIERERGTLPALIAFEASDPLPALRLGYGASTERL
jgi:hypothetical protein